MDSILFAQSWFNEGFLWAFLAIVALAILVWFLSWLLFPRSDPGPVSQSLSGLDRLDASMASKLRAFGVHSDQDLIRLSPRGQQELESQLGLHGGEYAGWRRQILSRWRTTYLPTALRDFEDVYPDPELGGLYAKKPDEVDELTKLGAVDRVTANRLNMAGIYTFEQIHLLTPEQRANFKRRFNLSGFDFEAVPSHGVTAATLARRVGLTGKSSGKDQAASGSVGRTTSATISAGAAQPASESGRTASSEGTSDTRVRVDSAGSLAAEKSPIPAPHTTASRDRPVTSDTSAETAFARSSSRIPTSETDADFGRIYTAPPPHRDDLSELDGIDKATASALNEAGIYTIDQLLSLSPSQQTNFRRRFDLPHIDFSRWRPTGPSTVASAKTAGLESATVAETELVRRGMPTDVLQQLKEHPRFGRIYSSPPTEKDDLTRLGIDSATQHRMNQAGIYTYHQLKSLDSEQRLAVQQEFDLAKVDFTDWRRCINAWSRGIDTAPDRKRTYGVGWLHGVRLPEIVTGVFDGRQLVAYPEQVIFRGSDPTHWGTDIKSPREGVVRALSASAIRSDINYVRIRRVDTRDSVVTAITKGNLFSPGPNEGNGWNGLCESFFGGRHLGIFARDIPNEVETQFGLGGWGFGHRFEHNDQQEWAWSGRLLEPTTFEISVGHIGSLSGTVVFRSSDPTIWNQRVREGANRLAIPIDGVTHPISFLRLLRIDTGEAIVIRADRASLLCRGDNPRLGWNGLNELFSGGHHLGIFHREAPQDVEICFGEGGWGFGHPFGDDDRQAYGWSGHAIGETVFEISVLQQLPDYLRHELLE